MIVAHGLRGERDDRQLEKARTLANDSHGLEAVHLRHHDVHQDEVDGRALVEPSHGFATVARDLDVRALRLEHAAEREDVPDVVLDEQDAPSLKQRLAIARLAQHALPLGRQLRLDLVQEERDLVEQALR